MATRSQHDLVGSEKLAASTGRSRAEWHALLDGAGAAEWTHSRIAEWLVTEHAVDGWWAQGITVGYEQARGTRQPGQRADGTFEAGASKTIHRGADVVFPAVSADERLAAWLGEGWSVVSATAPKRSRLRADDGSRALVELTVVSEGKVRVAVQHPGLPDSTAVADQKAFWKAALTRLADTLT